MGRRLHSPLDLMKQDLECRVVNEQLKQKKRHDAHAREVEIGDTVFARNFGQGDNWIYATITARTGPVSYQAEVEEDGLSWRRHIDQICARLNSQTLSGGHSCRF